MAKWLPLLTVPLLVALSAGALLHLIAPIYAGPMPYDYDPAYIYLFNGLGLIEGYVPQHTDHPGTPLQLLIGLIVFVIHSVMRIAGTAGSDIDASVVAAPESYLAAASAAVLALNVLAIFYLGLHVLRASGRIELALASQAGFLLLGSMTPRLTYISAEALIIFAAVMAAACFADLLLRPAPLSQKETRAAVIGSAFFIALGLTTKVTCLPFLLLPFLFRTRRDVVLCFLLIAGFAFVMLLPILPQLPRVLGWLLSILIHRGRYGYGDEGFVDVGSVPDHLYQLITANGFLFATGVLLALAGLVALARGADPDRASTLRTVAIFLGIAALQLVMTLKHFGLYYMLPTFGVYSIAFAYALTRLASDGSRRAARALAGFAAAAALVIGSAQLVGTLQSTRAEAQARNVAVAEIERTVARYPDALVIGAFRGRERRSAIPYALEFVAPDLAARLAKLAPDALSFNRWEGKLMVPGGPRKSLDSLNDVIAAGRTVLFIVPDDLELPNLVGERLLQIPGRETVFRVTRIEPSPSPSADLTRTPG